MRLLRVVLTDVRGIVGPVEVAFATDGVTVVEAPNESGKSTLLDAVDVALAYKDSSRHRDVVSLFPVDRDGPCTVEIELRCGEHQLVLTRTYRRQAATTLRVLAPRQETLTGDAAHDRLREILDADVDHALLAALRFTQGRPLDAVVLGDSDALTARLDADAGGTWGADDGGLYERAVAHRGTWLTATGQPAKPLKDLDAALAAAQATHATLTEQLVALTGDVEDLARLEEELPALHERRVTVLEPALAAATASAARIDALAATVAARRAEHQAARAAEQACEAAVAARAELIVAHDALVEDVARLADDQAEAVARLAALEDEALEGVLAAAEASLAAARERRTAAQLAYDLAEARREVAHLAAREARVQEILEQARAAEQALADLHVDAATLRGIRDAAQRLRTAQAALQTGAPRVTVRAHAEVALEVDGAATALAPGDEERRTVGSRLELSVPGLVDVEVVPGTSADALRQAADDARAALDDACRTVGCAGPDEAEAAAEERRRHEDTLARRDAELARELEGATRDELATRLQTARDRCAALERRVGPPTGAVEAVDGPADLVAAREARDAAVVAERAADDALVATRATRDAHADSLAELRTRVEVAASTLEDRRRRLAQAQETLAAARAVVGDDEARAAVPEAAAASATAEAALEAAHAELAELDPELVVLERDNLGRQLDDVRAQAARLEQRAAALRASLRVRGEDGLGERLQAAADELERVTADHRRAWARADAARLLVDELAAARDEAYQAYRAPLRERIGALARVLYGGRPVDLELDDDLAISHRTLEGVTLAWSQLSAGAREQLAIVAGLAAAQLAGHEGVPFVLDDALGYTDQERLERLGMLLGATRDAQVIVLTCVASRFQHVGGASTVALRELLRAGDRPAPPAPPAPPHQIGLAGL